MTNEAFARVKIDALLAAQGWDTLDTNAVRFEVMLPDGTRADYVLCDRHGRSVAVIEAKRFSNSPGDAAAQAKAYAQHEPPRLSWRPVGVSHVDSVCCIRLFGCSVFLSFSSPQGPPEALRLGHVLMVQPLASLRALEGRLSRWRGVVGASSLPRLRQAGCSRWARAVDGG